MTAGVRLIFPQNNLKLQTDFKSLNVDNGSRTRWLHLAEEPDSRRTVWYSIFVFHRAKQRAFDHTAFTKLYRICRIPGAGKQFFLSPPTSIEGRQARSFSKYLLGLSELSECFFSSKVVGRGKWLPNTAQDLYLPTKESHKHNTREPAGIKRGTSSVS